MPLLKPIGDPWLAFLLAIDEALPRAVEMHCIGGFALTLLIDRARPTGDVDFIQALPQTGEKELLGIAGSGTPLAAEHRLCVQAVHVADPPCNYEDRLIDATPKGFRNLRIMVLDPCDLVLIKAQRGAPKDRDDVRALIEEWRLERRTLERRFDEEVKPHLAVAPEKTVQVVELWLEEYCHGSE